MERRHFAHFIAVVDAGSISEAARRLRLSQPTVSQSIRDLELSLKTPLFVRGRRLTLTSAGRILVGPARQTLRAFDIARAAVDSVDSLHTGRLDIAVVNGLAVDPLAPLLIRFHRRFPRVSVRLIRAPFGVDGFETLRRREAELLLSDHPGPFPQHNAFTLPVACLAAAFSPQAVDLPPGETIALSELVKFPLIIGLPERTTSQQAFVARLALEDLPLPTLVVETEHRDVILPLVLAGVGVAVVSEPEAAAAAQMGAEVRAINVPGLRSAVLYHRQGPLSPAAQTFLTLLQS
jgi:DNA-binding transcriptional LysR family regulator